jgi:hypothetical protein
VAESRALLRDRLAPHAAHSGGCRTRKGYRKRDAGGPKVSLDEAFEVAEPASQDFVALDDALQAL